VAVEPLVLDRDHGLWHVLGEAVDRDRCTALEAELDDEVAVAVVELRGLERLVGPDLRDRRTGGAEVPPRPEGEADPAGEEKDQRQHDDPGESKSEGVRQLRHDA